MDTKCLVIINKLWTYLDRINGNTKWADAEKLEKNQLFEYETFDDRGHKSSSAAPGGYKKINLHFVYDVKHDGRFKARVVAGGHLTETPITKRFASYVGCVRTVPYVKHTDLYVCKQH